MQKSNNCPVCDGSGKAYDTVTGSRSDKDCLSCGGTGLAPWSDEFKALMKSGKIKPPKPIVASCPDALPAHVLFSRDTSDYEGYSKKARESGHEPLPQDTIKRMRRKYTEAGHKGLSWKLRWPKPMIAILEDSHSYGHFLWMVNQYNINHDKKLDATVGRSSASHCRRDYHLSRHRWSRKAYTMINAECTEIEHETEFRAITAKIANHKKYCDENWRICNNNSGEMLGTTLQLKLFMSQAGSIARTSVKEYMAWLKERERN